MGISSSHLIKEGAKPLSNSLEYITAGKAIFTIKNLLTENRFTYMAQRAKKIKTTFWIKVLRYPDNEDDNSYAYIGNFSLKKGFTYSGKSPISSEAISVRAADFYFTRLLKDALPPNIVTYHEGRCGRCGKRLTVPESIESGFGPECSKMLSMNIQFKARQQDLFAS